MFEKLRNAFANTAKSFSEKELKEKDINEILSELEISLLESDVAVEVVDSLKSELKDNLLGNKVERKQIEDFVKQSLVNYISKLFDTTHKIDLISNVSSKKSRGEPYLILFVGINGTGKTTTLAKIAYMLQQNNFSVVVAAADTYRAGAIEQLREHTNKLKIKLISQNYGSDPAAVARDAVLYAKSHKVDCVLVDSAGRMQTSKNLMDQISKISRVVNPDLKIFVGDSLAGNDMVSQAREFYRHVKFDGAILTKSDADARGGSAISIVKVTSAPVLYFGVGQNYEDLKPFEKESFIENIFGEHLTKGTKTLEQTPPAKPTIKEYADPLKVTQHVDNTREQKLQPSIQVSKAHVGIEKELKPKVERVEPSESSSDPFEGIQTNDIEKYAELYGVPTPDDDQSARAMATKIKKWISDGRPSST
ncbi:MAG: signal recognition particle receptor protein FtsY [Marine Group I thaumarchaeote]|nr:MAG: signal recognition particle receptor protein FtsY [Marine Group I thaumarchaeote]